MSVLRHALPAQTVGLLLAAAALALGLLPGAGWALALQALLAALCSRLLGAERWWFFIHLGFAPALVATLWLSRRLDIAPGWFLLAFVLLWLIHGHSHRTRVPLYLSNRQCSEALAGLLPPAPFRLLDAGAGIGSVLRPLARRFPAARFTGVELAPASWLLGWLLSRGEDNIDWRRGELFAHDWASYDVVYCFLSPVPMSAVWAKACAEMRPGSMLISNSFAIAGQTPAAVIELDDRTHSRLLVYHPQPCAPAARQGIDGKNAP